MQRILFVCLGNICRSPLAEGIMLDMKSRRGLNLHIDSAGTAGYHVGEAPDSRTVINARKNGIDLSPLRARQFQTTDFENFDLIFAMDESNYRNVISAAKNQQQRQKVNLFLEFALGKKAAVPDPYYGTEQDFEHVFRLVYEACDALCRKL